MPAKERESFDRKLNEFKKAGFSVKELPFPDFSQFLAVHQIVGSVEASSCAGRYDSVRYGKREPQAKNWNEMYLSSRGAAFGKLLKLSLIHISEPTRLLSISYAVFCLKKKKKKKQKKERKKMKTENKNLHRTHIIK